MFLDNIVQQEQSQQLEDKQQKEIQATPGNKVYQKWKQINKELQGQQTC